MRILTLAWVLLIVGCASPDRPPTQGGAGYGAASTQTTDAKGNTTVIITPPTPTDEALAAWVKYGALMAMVGIAAMLPIFGGNIRTGAVIAIGGVGMAAVGHFLGSVTISVPVWFLPALVVLVAGGMLWGWHIKTNQKNNEA